MNHVGNTKMVLHQTCSALATYQPQDQYDLKLSIERAPEDGKKKKQTKEDMAAWQDIINEDLKEMGLERCKV